MTGFHACGIRQLKIRRDISAVESPPEERGVPARGAVLGREPPINCGCETQWGLWPGRWRASGVPSIPLKGHTHRITHTHSHWAPVQDRSPGYSKRHWNVWLWGKSSLPYRNASRDHWSLPEPSPNRDSRQALYLSLKQAGKYCPTPRESLRPWPSQL